MNSKKRLASLAILVMEFNSLAMSAVSPALENIGQVFPDVPRAFISMLSTLPALICVPVGIFSTSMLGRKISFRSMAALGALFLFSGGIGPIFAKTFFTLLLWRMVFGIGMGVMAPMGSALLFVCFNKEEAEIQSSADTISNSVGAIVYQLLGGYLCSSLGWNSTFLVYLLILPTMGFVLFALCRIDVAKQRFLIDRDSGFRTKKSSAKYGRNFWCWCGLYGLFCILFYPLVTDMSALVLNNGYGNANAVSVILSCYTVGGALGGFLYHFPAIRRMNTKVFALVFSVAALGFFSIIQATNVLVLVMGAFIFGIGYGIFTAAIIIFAGYSVPRELRMGVMSRILVFTGLGEFASAFIISFIKNQVFHSSNDRFSYMFSFACLVILAALFLVKPTQKSYETTNAV